MKFFCSCLSFKEALHSSKGQLVALHNREIILNITLLRKHWSIRAAALGWFCFLVRRR